MCDFYVDSSTVMCNVQLNCSTPLRHLLLLMLHPFCSPGSSCTCMPTDQASLATYTAPSQAKSAVKQSRKQFFRNQYRSGVARSVLSFQPSMRCHMDIYTLAEPWEQCYFTIVKAREGLNSFIVGITYRPHPRCQNERCDGGWQFQVELQPNAAVIGRACCY